MKAVILAGGEGARLAPLTNVRPKPMLSVANKPILEHVIEAVKTAGINEIVLVVGYKRQRIQNYFGDGDDWGVDLEYVVQDTQLGSGHALLQAEPIIGTDLVVLNGDQIVDSAAITAVVQARQDTTNAVMAVSQSAETHLYGVVDATDGAVTDLIEKPIPAEVDSKLINAGVYAFGPEIFSVLRATDSDGELGLPAALSGYLDDHPVQAVQYEGEWFDISRPWDLLTANGTLLDATNVDRDQVTIDDSATTLEDAHIGVDTRIQPNATILRGTSLGDNVTIGAGAVVENAIVMDDATIGANTTIRDCIVGANATLGPGTVIEGGRADVLLGDTLHRDVRFGGIVGDNATVGAAVAITPGTRLGNDATVESQCALDGWYDPNATVRRG